MNNVRGNDIAKSGGQPCTGSHFGDGSDADACERVGALFGLSAAAAERDRRKAAEAELARLKGGE